LTRSHHSSPAETGKLPTIHIAGSDGVTFKTCTAEVFRPPSENESRSSQAFRETQGLRRPRFSFFIFTCQTARDPTTPHPIGWFYSSATDGKPQPIYVGCGVTHRSEEHQWRECLPWPRSQESARQAGNASDVYRCSLSRLQAKKQKFTSLTCWLPCRRTASLLVPPFHKRAQIVKLDPNMLLTADDGPSRSSWTTLTDQFNRPTISPLRTRSALPARTGAAATAPPR
jgi:hypothetical protein